MKRQISVCDLKQISVFLFERRDAVFWYERENAASGFALSLTIELLQLFTYRAVDMDDLAMNTLGAIGGYGIFCLIKKMFPGLIGSFQMPEQDCFWAKHGDF